jgi:hypothetical protein
MARRESPTRVETLQPRPSMINKTRYALCRDYHGLLWDALLYIPTVSALSLFAASNWYANKASVAYLLGFLACFFLIAGANRILTTRLMWLPSAPVAIETGANAANLILKSGEVIKLQHELRLYRDRSGRSFGLTGVSEQGRRRQFVFHRGQFSSDSDFQAVMNCYDSGRAVKS